MEKGKIITKIVESDSSQLSEELLLWIRQSAENRKEYIRYKNIWALLQQGKKMNRKHVTEDFRRVKNKIKNRRNGFQIREVIKYAAIILLSLTGGYLMHVVNMSHDLALNEISVPNGNRSSITLPDGSHAWLTNGSKLIYPDFKEGIRRVSLEGEAFFTVKSDEKRPFFVDLGKDRIKVTGTEFSVVSYPDDHFIQIDLISGKVHMEVEQRNGSGKFKTYELKPLHRLIIDRTTGEPGYALIPDGFYKYWKEGKYEFRNEPFEILAKKMERIFSVEIIFEDSLINNRTFSGTFYTKSNIYTIMETFKRASAKPFEYRIDKDRIYLKSME
jgi:ferric-dicitrate binding protein FerR (iron transport regulator)